MRIEEQHPRRKSKGDLFDDLPPELRPSAHYWLKHFIARRRRQGKSSRGWIFPILCGQARRLARNPPDSSWGRQMLGKRLARQQQSWEPGRVNQAKPPDQDGPIILLQGKCSGGINVNGFDRGQDLIAQVTAAIQREIAGDYRFKRCLGNPSSWEWQVRLTPIPRSKI